MLDLFAPAKFGDVQKPVHAGFQRDKRAEIRQPRNPAPVDASFDVIADDVVPRIRQRILERQCDAVVFPVEVDDDGLNRVARLVQGFRVLDPSPGHFRNRQKRLDAADVDKRAEVTHRGDHPLHGHAFFQGVFERLFLFLLDLFQKRPPRQDNIAAVFAVFDHEEVEFFADIIGCAVDSSELHLRKGAETARAGTDSYRKSPFDFLFNGGFQRNPMGVSVGQKLVHALAGKKPGREQPLAVARGKKIGRHAVAFPGGQMTLLVEKLLFIDIAFAFGAQIDEDPFRGNLDDGRLHFLAHGETFGGGVGLLKHFSKCFCIIHEKHSFGF